MQKTFGVVILAAGQSKRMHSNISKVLLDLAGEPVLFAVIREVQAVSSDIPIAIVVGAASPNSEGEIQRAIHDEASFKNLKIEFILQEEPKGTGHALQTVMNSAWGQKQIKNKTPILTLPGDQPLLTADLIRSMTTVLPKSTPLRMMTTEYQNPKGYGRVVKKGSSLSKIVEERDASEKEKIIREVVVSTYLFDPQFLSDALKRLKPQKNSGEYYLTDVIADAVRLKKRVEILKWSESEDLLQLNDPWQLAEVRKIKNRRILKKWAIQGIQFMDPDTTWVDHAVVLSEGAVIGSGVHLKGKTFIGRNSKIEPNVLLKNVQLEEEVWIKCGTVAEEARVAKAARVGPYAHLRPGSVIGEDAKIGNFVEIKKTKIGARTSVAHLSYLGDATVGKDVNIGCGFVTCNYDGKEKHTTVIEDEVFMGSDCQTVAPVRIRRGAYIASGSTITEDVEADSLAIARSRQVNKPEYAKKYSKQSKVRS